MLCLSRSRLDGIETILGVVVVVAAVVVVDAVVEGNAMVGAGVAGERVTGTAERGEGVTVSGGRCGWMVGWLVGVGFSVRYANLYYTAAEAPTSEETATISTIIIITGEAAAATTLQTLQAATELQKHQNGKAFNSTIL